MEIILIKSYTDKQWRSHDTYQLIEKSLKEKWLVHSINTKNPLTLFGFIRRLQWNHRNKVFVFNIAEYLDEKNKIGFLPAFLDEMEIPFLGSSAESVEIGLDKNDGIHVEVPLDGISPYRIKDPDQEIMIMVGINQLIIQSLYSSKSNIFNKK